jgi:hypothetical protein
MKKASRARSRWAVLAAVVTTGLLATGVAGASSPFTTITTFEGPPFGLSNLSGKAFYASVGGAGPILVDNGAQSPVNFLPGISDAVPAGGDKVLAVGFGLDETAGLFLVSPDGVDLLADIGAFEEAVDPADDGVETNPFDVERIGRLQAVVADAAGNSLLHVSNSGEVDWIASFPNEEVECLIFICGEPGILVDADPVSTSVAIGPDGAYYVGELKGAPAAPGTSKVWRIEPGTRHAVCGESPACSVVGTGFTAVIDVVFHKGKLYVVELDEAGWIAAEEGFGVGGTINECTLGPTLTCTERATGLFNPTAVAFNRNDMYATLIDFETFGGQLVSIP